MTALERVSAQAPDVAAILARHFDLMRSQTPEESCHVLPAEAMAAPDIALFALREQGRPVAIGALRLMGRQGPSFLSFFLCYGSSSSSWFLSLLFLVSG